MSWVNKSFDAGHFESAITIVCEEGHGRRTFETFARLGLTPKGTWLQVYGERNAQQSHPQVKVALIPDGDHAVSERVTMKNHRRVWYEFTCSKCGTARQVRKERLSHLLEEAHQRGETHLHLRDL